MCSDGIIIEHCGREGDAVAKIDCDRSNNDSSKKTWCSDGKGWFLLVRKIGSEFGWKDERLIRTRKDRIIGDICKILIILDRYRMYGYWGFSFDMERKRTKGLIFIYSFRNIAREERSKYPVENVYLFRIILLFSSWKGQRKFI